MAVIISSPTIFWASRRFQLITIISSLNDGLASGDPQSSSLLLETLHPPLPAATERTNSGIMGKSKKRRSGGGGGSETTVVVAPTEPRVKNDTTSSKARATNMGTQTIVALKNSTATHHPPNGEQKLSMQDWISSLAKQNTDETTLMNSSSKEERKERRAAKKRQRQERKDIVQQKQQQQAVAVARKGEQQQQQPAHGRRRPPPPLEKTLQRLEQLARHIENCSNSSSTKNAGLTRTKPCLQPNKEIDDDNDLCDKQSGTEPEEEEEPNPRKKARRRQEMRLHNHHLYNKKNKPFTGENKVCCLRKRNWDTTNHIQPRSNHDYNGMGLARPSLLLSFSDPSFIEQLQQEFVQHVPGFFKRRHNKADKKRRDGNMLWRQLQQNKNKQQQNETDAANNQRKKQKQNSFLSKLSPNERVEAMLQAGIL